MMGGSLPWLVSAQLAVARPSCLRLFWDWVRAAASRTFWTAGSSRPMRMAMMAITTSSSISVNPRRTRRDATGEDTDMTTSKPDGKLPTLRPLHLDLHRVGLFLHGQRLDSGRVVPSVLLVD